MKTGRDDGSFSIIGLTECQEDLSERQFGQQMRDTYFCLELTFVHKVLALIPTRIRDFTDFFQDISLDNETKPQCPRLRLKEVY